MSRKFHMLQESELILNSDGTIFHLHLKPENISEKIILVGDPGRVDVIGSFFDNIEFSAQNREFKTLTGTYNNNRITVISTGIGTDNIDIVLNELDALANIDLKKRLIKAKRKSLDIVRIGTSGGLQQDLPVNTFVVAEKSIGFDGLLNFYDKRDEISDLDFEKHFIKFTGWSKTLAAPYVVNASQKLLQKFNDPAFHFGVTISAPGFYGPQGRVLRLQLANPELNHKIEDFSYKNKKITNFEMECSAIYGLSKLLNHNALTVCLLIANRVSKKANESYHHKMKELIGLVLNRLIQ